MTGTEDSPMFKIHEKTEAGIFFLVTIEVNWLSTWRDKKAISTNDQLVDLKIMISSLRTVDANRKLTSQSYPPVVAMAASSSHTMDLDAGNKKCRPNYWNKDCFKRHPEIRARSRGKTNIMSEVDHYEDSSNSSETDPNTN